MLKLSIDNERGCSISAKGSLCELCSDTLTLLTCLRDSIAERFSEEDAEMFVDLISENMKYVRNPEKLPDICNDKLDELLQNMIDELDELKKKIDDDKK